VVVILFAGLLSVYPKKTISQLRSYDRYILNSLLPKIFLYYKKAILDLSQAAH